MEKLLGGEEHLVEFPGSQYSQGTSSACGLIALNCVRLLLDLEYGGKREDELVALMCRQGFIKVSTVHTPGAFGFDLIGSPSLLDSHVCWVVLDRYSTP